MQFAAFLFFATALLASNDLVGSIEIGGGNLRIGLIPMAVFIGWAAALVRFEAIARPYAGVLLLMWTIANTLFIFNASQSFRTYAYTIWLWLFVLFVFATGVVFSDRTSALRLARLSIAAYAAVALFGLAQFALFAFGINVLVEQQWMSGVARINGLSYEPSYFATYMIAGWAILLTQLAHRVYLWHPWIEWTGFALVTVVLLLCSSRIGYLGMVLLVLLLSPRLIHLVASSGVAIFLALCVAVGGVVGAVSLISDRSSAPFWLLEGTGIADTAAHSVEDRLMGLEEYWSAFAEDPFLGYSLGGVAARVYGAGFDDSVSNESLRHSQGINVSMEILLATGALFAPLFFAYLWKLTGGLRGFLRMCPDKKFNTVVAANAVGLATQFFLLQFNQNILRTYFWIQVAVTAALAGVLLRLIFDKTSDVEGAATANERSGAESI
jgi:hypothetical protein